MCWSGLCTVPNMEQWGVHFQRGVKPIVRERKGERERERQRERERKRERELNN